MTEFKYCVHCENEPAVCFNTEVDAMKFARDCTGTCSCIKVEKSEIDEDGEILSTEIIWATDCDDVVEKEIISDNEFDTEFPVSDIENINISDDIEYDEIAKQYKEGSADWIDDNKLIKEAVDALEENESEVECKCCFDIFPKENCIKTENGYVCKKCNQEIRSHQGTNLDLIDSDPFSLDYEDPRYFDEPEEIEVKEEPVNANKVRKFEAGIEEKIEEHINDRPADIESDQEYQGVDNAVVDCKKYTLVAHSEDEKPVDCKLEKPALEEPLAGEEVGTKLNEELKVITNFSNYKPWSGAVDTYELIKDADKLDELEFYLEELYPDGITATQINDILWFDGEEILKYLELGDEEDEEIDEALTEGILTEFTPVAPHPILYKEIDKAYGNNGGFLVTKRRKGKNESESAKKTNSIIDAIKFVKELAKNKDIAEIHLQIVKTSKDVLIYKDGKETFNKIVEVGKNLQAENKTKVDGNTISDIDELRDNVKRSLEKLFTDIANNYKEAEQDQIKEILQKYAKQLRTCTTKDEIITLDAVNKSKAEISKLKTKADYEAEETTDKESNDTASTDNTSSTTKIKTDAAAAALKNAYPNNDKQIRIVLSMLKKANLTEDINENLEEAKKDTELPVDPEAAKLEVHTMLNDLVADEIEAINGYDNAKAQIIDTPIEHKDSILDTIDHIKEEEQEHIDELIDATTEIPFEKEEAHDFAAEEESLTEDTHAKYAKPEGDRVAAYNNALKYAKKENKPYIYGYTNHTGKFFAAETPMKVTGSPADAEKEFRSRYKNCNVVYVAYPDKDFIDENLKEDKKVDELPVDPEAAKLNVHTMLNDLVADEIEAINGYEDAKSEIVDTPIAHKDNILDTIDHIKEEEQEHIDELIDAATEIPFDKEEETSAPEVEEPLNQDFPEVNEKLDKDSKLDYDTLEEIKSNIYNVIKKYWETVFSDEWFYEDSFSLEQDYYDEKLLVVKFKLRKEAYFKRESDFENFKASLKTIPSLKLKNIHKKLVNVNFYFSDDTRFIKVDEIVFQLIDKSLTETKAKPEGNKVKSYNDGLRLAKLHNKPVIYGYTNSSYGNKFFALDDPIICDNVSDETKKFKQQYKSCNVVYVAYPNGRLIEHLMEEDIKFDVDGNEIFTKEEQEEYDCDEYGNSNTSYDQFHHCGWCEEVYPEYDMRHEVDFGWICSRCEDELKSHGGPLTFIEK